MNKGRKLKPTVEERFWEKVSPEPNSGCWLWEGSLVTYTRKGKTYGGYGSFRVDDKLWRAHRWAWTRFVGPIPDGMDFDHRVCRIKCCVNPDHMVLCSPLENWLQPDGGAGLAKAKTHCPAGHLYNEDSTRYDGKGWRFCVICRDIRNAARPPGYWKTKGVVIV